MKLTTSKVPNICLRHRSNFQELSAADRLVAQAQARRNALVAQSSSLAPRISLQQAAAQGPEDEKGTPGLEGDQVVMLSDSDDEQAAQHVLERPAAGREGDDGFVDLLSDSDASAASDSEEEEADEDSVFPSGAALDLDLPARCRPLPLCCVMITSFAALPASPF